MANRWYGNGMTADDRDDNVTLWVMNTEWMYKLLQETITKITTKKWSLNAAIYRLKSRFGDTTGDGCPITTRAIKAIINAELEEIKP